MWCCINATYTQDIWCHVQTSTIESIRMQNVPRIFFLIIYFVMFLDFSRMYRSSLWRAVYARNAILLRLPTIYSIVDVPLFSAGICLCSPLYLYDCNWYLPRSTNLIYNTNCVRCKNTFYICYYLPFLNWCIEISLVYSFVSTAHLSWVLVFICMKWDGKPYTSEPSEYTLHTEHPRSWRGHSFCSSLCRRCWRFTFYAYTQWRIHCSTQWCCCCGCY